MRSIKLTTAGAAAAALLALAPAGALAGRRHAFAPGRRARSCRVTLRVAPRLLYSGEHALAWGRASCPQNANQTVTLYQDAIGSPGYTAAGTTTSDGAGGFALSTPPISANTVFYAVVGASASERRRVRAIAQVTLSGPAASALPDAIATGRTNEVPFTGTVSPEDVGARVVLQRQNALTGNEWRRIGRSVVGAGGRFTIRHRFLVPGDANLRVLVRSSHRNVASPSNILNYVITQAQNPQLTIESPADPIAYGQQVAIHGTVAGAAKTTVTLLARVRHGGRLAPVAQTTTDASGNYAFAPQAPVYSTFYEVRSDGRSSTVLYEDVRDVLTAALEPATGSVQAGQTLEFSGTVSPDHSGHAIYLERESAAGTFHVVEVSRLAPGSSYAIAHTVYDVGTNVFRVRVPGDPQNGGALSQTFTVQVTPPSAAERLTPEAPGNSTLPPEGQV